MRKRKKANDPSKQWCSVCTSVCISAAYRHKHTHNSIHKCVLLCRTQADRLLLIDLTRLCIGIIIIITNTHVSHMCTVRYFLLLCIQHTIVNVMCSTHTTHISASHMYNTKQRLWCLWYSCIVTSSCSLALSSSLSVVLYVKCMNVNKNFIWQDFKPILITIKFIQRARIEKLLFQFYWAVYKQIITNLKSSFHLKYTISTYILATLIFIIIQFHRRSMHDIILLN